MSAKTSTIFALFALAAQVAVATPPACLIAAVNTQPDPAAIKEVCSGDNVTAVVQYICQKCGDNADLAMDGLSDVCGDAGVTLDDKKSCSKSSSSDNSDSTPSDNSTAPVPTTPSSPTEVASKTASYCGGGASTGLPTPTGYNGTGTTPSVPIATGGYNNATPSMTPEVSNTAAVARLGMDVVGMLALGVFGAMLAL